MSLPTPSTRPSRRLRRAGSLAATAAIALSAVVGFGVAPASADDAPYPNFTGYDRIAVHTHWASSAIGFNVRSFRLIGPGVVVNGKRQRAYDHCFSMGNPRPGVEQDATIVITVPGNDYTVISYADNTCQRSYQRIGGASSGVSTGYHDWTMYSRRGPYIHN